MKDTAADPAIEKIFTRFYDGNIVSADMIDTSRGETDFRNTFIFTTEGGEKRVLKIVSNDFTFPEKIRMWQRTIEEYRGLGYYCPRIISDKNGEFPELEYQGHPCVAYGEEYSRYKSLEDRTASDNNGVSNRPYAADIWTMTARVAAKKLDYTDFPSGYCLFETFCPSDPVDEVLEVALEWKKTADALPEEFSGQVRRIWDLWSGNRKMLEELYAKLPTSVFQADLNASNLLIDEDGSFKGVCDFNLCGKDVFLNYLIRENHEDFEEEIEMIREALRIASGHYTFSEAEKQAVLPLYRCLKPLWYSRVEELKKAENNGEKIRRCLDEVEYYLTADIDFVSCMGGLAPADPEADRRMEEKMNITEIKSAAEVIDEAAVRGKYNRITLMLIEKGRTITTMESCTSGQVASLITDTEGSSAVMKGAFVTYSNEAKIRMGVPAEVIEKHGVYSAETAAAMAQACRPVYGADIAVGITGSFGNADPNNSDSIPGEVYFALADQDGTRCFHCTVPAQPSRLAYKLYMADVVADQLLKIIG